MSATEILGILVSFIVILGGLAAAFGFIFGMRERIKLLEQGVLQNSSDHAETVVALNSLIALTQEMNMKLAIIADRLDDGKIESHKRRNQ